MRSEGEWAVSDKVVEQVQTWSWQRHSKMEG